MDFAKAEATQDPRLSVELERLLALAGGKALRVRDIVQHLRGRGLPIVIIVLCLPFLAPVSIPGLSIPFGAAIALCGLRIAFGREPWLPGFIMNIEVPYGLLSRITGFGARLYRRVEKIIRPRLHFLRVWPGMMNLTGFMIALGAVVLSLPIPPPFPLTNTVPGLAIILLSLGLLERDGVLILLGYFLVILGATYAVLIFLLGKAGVTALWHHLENLF